MYVVIRAPYVQSTDEHICKVRVREPDQSEQPSALQRHDETWANVLIKYAEC